MKITNNPWWTDFLESTCLNKEKNLFDTQKAGKLHASGGGAILVETPSEDMVEKLDVHLWQ